MESAAGNIVEAHHRNILGNPSAGFLQRADRTDGRDVVEGEQGGERFLGSHQLPGRDIARLGRWAVAAELRDQGRRHANLHLARHATDGVPSHLGIGAEFLAADKCNVAVSQILQVAQAQFSRSRVVQNDARYAGRPDISGDTNHG